jgi:CubicO group peptidase (beta-lactamase class C family)
MPVSPPISMSGSISSSRQAGHGNFTASLSCAKARDEFRRYGYFWYVGDFQYGNPPNRPIAHWIGAFGYGGQRLFVLPELDIVVAITAGNYDDPNQWMPPIRVIREVVLPSLS